MMSGVAFFMKRDRAHSRCTHALAIAWGIGRRWSVVGGCMYTGAPHDAAAWRYFTTSSLAFSSDSVLPGAMQLTQMLSLPTSIASVRVKPRMPALEVT